MNDLMAKWRLIVGWVAVAISVAASCFWAYWGSNENFHEGWFYSSFWQNVGLMFVQYLSPMLVLVLISSVALRWPRLALPILGSFAVVAAWFFRHGRAAVGLIVIPLLAVGVLYQFGRPQPRHWALRCLIALPLITAVVSGAYPGWRAMHRLDDGNYGIRLVEGNGVALVWAPEGPGWPSRGSAWLEAKQGCAHLTADGRSLSDQPQNLWRLPTVDEAVRSLVFRGRNAGGTWDPVLHQAKYRMIPDKDSPLWKDHSQIIYWWTDTEVERDQAYYITTDMLSRFASKFGQITWAFGACVNRPR